jgi:hypothetical protein
VQHEITFEGSQQSHHSCVNPGVSHQLTKCDKGFKPQAVGDIMNALAALKHHPGEELLGMMLERYQHAL